MPLYRGGFDTMPRIADFSPFSYMRAAHAAWVAGLVARVDVLFDDDERISRYDAAVKYFNSRLNTG